LIPRFFAFSLKTVHSVVDILHWKGGSMSKDELIKRIERFNTPHDRRLLKQYSEERLTEYLDYLQRVSMPRKVERVAS
jgi:hypothetical protein